MLQLLQTFSLSDILIFAVLFVLALKGSVEFMDWLSDRGFKFFKRRYQRPRQIEQSIKKMEKTIQALCIKVDLLTQSDKDAIKAYITKEHHYFVYQKGWIDDYSMDCIQRRYVHYNKEGGNSFIDALMQDLRDLPTVQRKTFNE